jgi:GNAT superfamily N-acetyltransferase
MHKIDIIPFEDIYASNFHALNVEWLEKYFYVEPYDEKVLSNPKKYILQKGGYIFFALHNNEIIGTVALINQESFYELSKMAVKPKYQVQKIGLQLINFCITFARDNNWKGITLYSHRKLIPAIVLYKRNGFVEVELEEKSHYKRSDIKMRLDF